ncbi:MAG: GrpB family protein [Colwellia sp.]|nr:GrpB family protein [Colwellia sp.]
MELNLNHRVIDVIDYDPRWKDIFEIEKELLVNAIGSNAISIEHIGSTSVEGLVAKPVIDILIEVTSLKKLDASSNKIVALAYLVKGENGISARRYFQKVGKQRTHHLHAFQTGDLNLMRHRAFKAYLIAHPLVSSAYGQIKKAAMYNSDNNINRYMALKNEFIEKHEKIAIAWFSD